MVEVCAIVSFCVCVYVVEVFLGGFGVVFVLIIIIIIIIIIINVVGCFVYFLI